MAKSVARAASIALLVASFLPGCASHVAGVASGVSVPSPEVGLHVVDEYLAGRLASLEGRAMSLNLALDSVRRGRLVVRIGTTEQISRLEPWAGTTLRPGRLGQLSARFDTTSGAVERIVVQIDLKAITRHQLQGLPTTWFSTDERQTRLDRLVDHVLIHEVWGHMVPLALAANIRGACRDAQPGARDRDSCVVRRENELRAELDNKRRSYASLDRE